MTAENRKIVLGTRGSELARAQARLVEQAIRAANPEINVETKVIATYGDTAKAVDLRAGRKGLFTAAIERALVASEVDIAVHSAKDLPSEIAPDTEIAAVLPRAPVHDVLVSTKPGGLDSLPQSGVVATGSVRRQRQLLWQRPDLKVVDLRGNVPTRLRKLAESDWAAIILASAGVHRLDMLSNSELNLNGQRFFFEMLSKKTFLPAGGQGIIAIQVRSKDQKTTAILKAVNDWTSFVCLQAEREFLRRLNADCNCPVGVFAEIENGKMRMRAQVFTAEAAVPWQSEVAGGSEEPCRLAAELSRQIPQAIS